jgi:hypothetical protein
MRRKRENGRRSKDARSDQQSAATGRAAGFWRSVSMVLGFTILIVVSLGAVYLLLIRPQPEPVATFFSPSQIKLQFGLSREAITRASRFDLCAAEATTRDFPECKNRSKSLKEGSTSRPAIAAVGLENDLADSRGRHQFPANQVTVTAANVGRSSVAVNMTANPTEPTRVHDGQYIGRIIIDRSDGRQIKTDVLVELAPRSGAVTAKVLLALALGALGGALIKWLDDSFGPIAALRRRQRRVENFLRARNQRENPRLPEGVVRRLVDIRSAIRAFDPEGVAGTLQLITSNQDALIAFDSGLQALEGHIETQRRLVEHRITSPALLGAISMETTLVRELRSRVWPWEKAEEVTKALQEAERAFGQLTLAMRRAQYDNKYIKEVDALASKMIHGGPEAIGQGLLEKTLPTQRASVIRIRRRSAASLPSPAARDDLQTVGVEDKPDGPQLEPERRGLGLWLLDNAWWLTLAVLAALVIFLGFQTQFLDNLAFQGDRTDYIQLAAWALAIQVAGGTIIDTAGKLRTSRATV